MTFPLVNVLSMELFVYFGRAFLASSRAPIGMSKFSIALAFSWIFTVFSYDISLTISLFLLRISFDCFWGINLRRSFGLAGALCGPVVVELNLFLEISLCIEYVALLKELLSHCIRVARDWDILLAFLGESSFFRFYNALVVAQMLYFPLTCFDNKLRLILDFVSLFDELPGSSIFWFSISMHYSASLVILLVGLIKLFV